MHEQKIATLRLIKQALRNPKQFQKNENDNLE